MTIHQLPPCEQTEPISCETCEDTGWMQIVVEEGPYGQVTGDIECTDCGGQTPTFLPGVDDVLEGAREGWHR